MKKYVFICLFTLISANFFAQSHFSAQSHQSAVTKIAPRSLKDELDISFITSDNSGFLIKWGEDNLGEHYQISDVEIKIAVCSPNGRDVAVYETDGGSVNRVTVWDWSKLTKKYTKKLKDSVTSLSFSAKGTYLIIGTATVDGAVFVRTSDWSTVNKIKDDTGIVNYIHTSASEKIAVMYSPKGTLSYYNLQTGKIHSNQNLQTKNHEAKFSCTQGLSDVTLFANELFLAGIKDGSIYVIGAMSGKTISAISASNPIILSSESDDKLYFLEYDGRTSYDLKMIEKIDGTTISNPRYVKNFKGPRGDAAIVTGAKIGTEIVLGSRNGAVYKVDIFPSTSTESLSAITEDIYSKIYDIEPSENNFYFLTSDSIFKSSYDSGVVDKMTDTNGESNLISYNGNMILFSNETRQPIRIVDMTTKSSETLFTPKNNVQSVKIYGEKLIEIESSSTVNLYDLTTKKLTQIFSGMGIQDAVLADDGNVYIAKSSSTSPNSPLISVNPETLETVPLTVPGQVTYGLSTNGKMIYGINLVLENGVSTTYVFSYAVSSRKVTNILKFAEEDPEAFTYLSGDFLYTNIGKNKVYSYNIPQKKRFSYNRSASIPIKVCRSANRVVILNSNGSISWAGTTSANLLADWYLTKEGQWFEF